MLKTSIRWVSVSIHAIYFEKLYIINSNLVKLIWRAKTEVNDKKVFEVTCKQRLKYYDRSVFLD